MIQKEPCVIKSIHFRSLFSSVLLKPSSQYIYVLNQEEVRNQVRRKINGSESEEILKEKSSKKKGQQIYIIEHEKSSIDGLLKRDFGLRVTYEADLERERMFNRI